METGRGTYMEGRWNLVPEPERFRLCRDQETDRQKADREMREWQEEQRRLREGGAPAAAQQEQGKKNDEEPSPQPSKAQGQAARGDEPAPCARPDIVGECQATPAQILYQIRRSKETGGETNK